MRNVRLPQKIVQPFGGGEVARRLACCDASTPIRVHDPAMLLLEIVEETTQGVAAFLVTNTVYDEKPVPVSALWLPLSVVWHGRDLHLGFAHSNPLDFALGHGANAFLT